MSRYRAPALAKIQSIEATGNDQYTARVIQTGAEEPTTITFSVAARSPDARSPIGEALPAYAAPAVGQHIDMNSDFTALYDVKPTRVGGSLNVFVRPVTLQAA